MFQHYTRLPVESYMHRSTVFFQKLISMPVEPLVSLGWVPYTRTSAYLTPRRDGTFEMTGGMAEAVALNLRPMQAKGCIDVRQCTVLNKTDFRNKIKPYENRFYRRKGKTA